MVPLQLKGFNSGIGSIAIGSAIGNIASQAMMRGMDGLKNLVLAPFKKFGSMFSERIGDEMDDIKSAGGLFSLDMDLTQESGNERFFKNYNEALRFQEKLNIDDGRVGCILAWCDVTVCEHVSTVN